MDSFWVFGYGSLMWNPGFPYQEVQRAEADGWHRSLCIYSHHYRGTKERPGLVMGLNPGGSCCGMAFLVHGNNTDAAYRYLVGREQRCKSYDEKRIPLTLADGSKVRALVFASNPGHEMFAGDLAVPEIAQIVSCACGIAGTNRAYLTNTMDSLRELRICEPKLEEVLRELPKCDEARLDAERQAKCKERQEQAAAELRAKPEFAT